MSVECFDCKNEVYNCACIDKMLRSWVGDKKKTTEIVENMYQITTTYPLAQSKKYFRTLKECASHLCDCIKETKRHLKNKVGADSIKEGCRLLKINLKEYPKLARIMGKEKEISTDNLDLLPLTKEKKNGRSKNK